MALVANNAVDTSAYTGVGSIGIGHPILGQPPVTNTNYPLGPQHWQPNNYMFQVTKVENGWTIGIGNKQWICTTPQELGDRMVTILVEERLDK